MEIRQYGAFGWADINNSKIQQHKNGIILIIIVNAT